MPQKKRKAVSWEDARRAAGSLVSGAKKLGKKFWQSEIDKMNRQLAKGEEFAKAFRAGPNGTKEQKKLIDDFMMGQVKTVGGIQAVGGKGASLVGKVYDPSNMESRMLMGGKTPSGVELKYGSMVSHPKNSEVTTKYLESLLFKGKGVESKLLNPKKVNNSWTDAYKRPMEKQLLDTATGQKINEGFYGNTSFTSQPRLTPSQKGAVTKMLKGNKGLDAIKQKAIDYGMDVNNYLDDDFVFEAIQSVKKAKGAKALKSALESLSAGISFRKGSASVIEKLLKGL